MTYTTFLFQPKNSDTLEDWSRQINSMYLPGKKVKMYVDLTHFNSMDIKKMLGLKCVLDVYRPITRILLEETIVKIDNPVMKNFVKGCLVIFKPEKPVKFI